MRAHLLGNSHYFYIEKKKENFFPFFVSLKFEDIPAKPHISRPIVFRVLWYGLPIAIKLQSTSQT